MSILPQVLPAESSIKLFMKCSTDNLCVQREPKPASSGGFQRQVITETAATLGYKSAGKPLMTPETAEMRSVQLHRRLIAIGLRASTFKIARGAINTRSFICRCEGFTQSPMKPFSSPVAIGV